MILEAIILAAIVLFFLKDKDISNLINFKFKGISLASIGIFLMIFINFVTSKYFGKVTDFFVDNFKIFHILSILLIGISLLLNYKNYGLLLSGAGTILNAIPVIFNGKMPVSIDALMKTNNERIIKIIYMGGSLSHGIFENPKFYFLSDIIPLHRIVGNSKVISIGDIFISIGLFFAIILISRKRGV
ncbi:DUF5317 domain-containing protein [Peptoniphilus sp. AGMB00490]|uniref:DUF5317 domain-containing protein n=3 Tax=Peptoniphilus TaxID=162289 RepID=A0ACD6AYV0_9FIRM|nr:DUF5317 domain-containing protein [Peptoniphilus faecalis]OLR64379.1 hypothetical protein BIV18_01865 [Peptoniphilus porci]